LSEELAPRTFGGAVCRSGWFGRARFAGPFALVDMSVTATCVVSAARMPVGRARGFPLSGTGGRMFRVPATPAAMHQDVVPAVS
jgi:hypothetical protein